MLAVQKADSLLSYNPDSALAVLNTVKMSDISTTAEKSRFFLCNIMALDRSGLPLIGESEMKEAAGYFSSNGTAREKMLSRYYLGRLLEKGDDYYGAMEQYVLAGYWNGRLRYPGVYYSAQIYLHKGRLYHERMNFTRALSMYEKGVSIIKRDTCNSLYMRLLGSAGKECGMLGANIKAVSYYSRAAVISRKLADTVSYVSYLTSIEGVKFSIGASSDGILHNLSYIYKTYTHDTVPLDNYIMLACLYMDRGDGKKAAGYAKKYMTASSDLKPVEKAGIYSLLCSVAQSDRDYEKALEYNRKYAEIMDDINSSDKVRSIRDIEQEYRNRRLVMENKAVKIRNRLMLIIFLLVITAVIFISFMIFSYIRNRIREKNKKIEEYLVMAEEASKYRNALLDDLDEHKENEKKLKGLLENRFAEVRELAGTYYQYGSSKKLQKKVDELISLRSPETDMFRTMEEVVDAKNNGAISKIRKSYPSICEDNIKLLNLIYAGFSPQEMSVILNDTPQNIYVRKSRLKRKISDLIKEDESMDF
jgi:tetratricopeptide (TPR) repeat protein